MEKFKMTPMEKKWAFYDVGNSAYILMVTTIFQILFLDLVNADPVLVSEATSAATSAGVDPSTAVETQGLIYWGYALSISTILSIIVGPIMGSIADLHRLKKELLITTAAVGSLCSIGLGVIGSWSAFLILFVISKVAFSSSLIIYDSMLVDITDKSRMDYISSFGYAVGYIGSCIPFVTGMVFVVFGGNLGLSFGTTMLIAFTINAVWWMAFTIPLAKSYRQKYKITGKPQVFKHLKNTAMDVAKDKKVLLYLIAVIFFMDGVYTMMEMASGYGMTLGIDQTGILGALLMTQIVAFPATIIMGRLAQKYGNTTLLSVSIIGYIGIAIFAVFMSTQLDFWLTAFFVAIFQGSIQALSRSYFGQIIPQHKSGEYFSLYDICGKGASFMGTALAASVTDLTKVSSMGVATIAPCIAVGFILLRMALKLKSETELADEQGTSQVNSDEYELVTD